jgi:hypothetical protein
MAMANIGKSATNPGVLFAKQKNGKRTNEGQGKQGRIYRSSEGASEESDRMSEGASLGTSAAVEREVQTGQSTEHDLDI